MEPSSDTPPGKSYGETLADKPRSLPPRRRPRRPASFAFSDHVFKLIPEHIPEPGHHEDPQASGLFLKPRPWPTLDSHALVHATISKDHTNGEDARQADLFAALGPRLRHRPPKESPSTRKIDLKAHSPATPSPEEQEDDRRQKATFSNVPKLDRTTTDIYNDELYNPNLIEMAVAPTYNRVAASSGKNDLAERLRVAHNQHLNATHPPVSNSSRDRPLSHQILPIPPIPPVLPPQLVGGHDFSTTGMLTTHRRFNSAHQILQQHSFIARPHRAQERMPQLGPGKGAIRTREQAFRPSTTQDYLDSYTTRQARKREWEARIAVGRNKESQMMKEAERIAREKDARITESFQIIKSLGSQKRQEDARRRKTREREEFERYMAKEEKRIAREKDDRNAESLRVLRLPEGQKSYGDKRRDIEARAAVKRYKESQMMDDAELITREKDDGRTGNPDRRAAKLATRRKQAVPAPYTTPPPGSYTSYA